MKTIKNTFLVGGIPFSYMIANACHQSCCGTLYLINVSYMISNESFHPHVFLPILIHKSDVHKREEVLGGRTGCTCSTMISAHLPQRTKRRRNEPTCEPSTCDCIENAMPWQLAFFHRKHTNVCVQLMFLPNALKGLDHLHSQVCSRQAICRRDGPCAPTLATFPRPYGHRLMGRLANNCLDSKSEFPSHDGGILEEYHSLFGQCHPNRYDCRGETQPGPFPTIVRMSREQ